MMYVYQGNDELLMHRHKKIGTGNLLSPIPIFILCKPVILPAYWYMCPGI